VDRAAEGVIGEPLDLSAEEVSRALDPVRFVELRTLPGGPAPQVMRRALDERRAAHARATSVYRERADAVRERLHALDTIAKGWGER
jgi:argininosuccinate lyase